MPISRAILTLVLGGTLALATTAWAQWGWGRIAEGPGVPVRHPVDGFSDGMFTVCKLMYTSVVREPLGMGWATDYPYAGINLMTRVSELTRTPISRDAQGEPNYWVVSATDPALFRCPYLMAADVGTLRFSAEEAARMREYLLKGGFLWVDDFWGTAAWQQWTRELGKVLPPSEYPIEDVPLTDPIFSSQFVVSQVPQITNIGFWRRTRGRETSERGDDSRDAHFRAIRDSHGRIMVVMTHNTDVADSWEREGEDAAFFYQFSPNGYALGINVLLYAMTH
jgi:hypothetical protein